MLKNKEKHGKTTAQRNNSSIFFLFTFKLSCLYKNGVKYLNFLVKIVILQLKNGIYVFVLEIDSDFYFIFQFTFFLTIDVQCAV